MSGPARETPLFTNLANPNTWANAKTSRFETLRYLGLWLLGEVHSAETTIREQVGLLAAHQVRTEALELGQQLPKHSAKKPGLIRAVVDSRLAVRGSRPTTERLRDLLEPVTPAEFDERAVAMAADQHTEQAVVSAVVDEHRNRATFVFRQILYLRSAGRGWFSTLPADADSSTQRRHSGYMVNAPVGSAQRCREPGWDAHWRIQGAQVLTPLSTGTRYIAFERTAPKIGQLPVRDSG